MRWNGTLVGLLIASSLLRATDAESVEAGRKMERTACVACHSLRLVESQRLSTAAWTKEMDKMIGWGATVADRQRLIEYLAQEYGDSKPVPPADKSVPR